VRAYGGAGVLYPCTVAAHPTHASARHIKARKLIAGEAGSWCKDASFLLRLSRQTQARAGPGPTLGGGYYIYLCVCRVPRADPSPKRGPSKSKGGHSIYF